jgi:hypothetical protein
MPKVADGGRETNMNTKRIPRKRNLDVFHQHGLLLLLSMVQSAVSARKICGVVVFYRHAA